MQDNDIKLISVLERIANALEGRPAAPAAPALDPAVNAYVYEAERHALQPVRHVSAPPLALVLGVDRPRDALLENTRRFARGAAANNALLWGARGMGKSTLVKAVHQAVLPESPLSLVEIHREDIAALPALLAILKAADGRFIIFCDDLSFDQPDRDFKALKSVLEGGLEGRPDNVIFYATSNRRHLLPRQMMDQEAATGIHPTEAMDETIALSDRFGLWLGFYPCDQDTYLGIVRGYLAHFGLDTSGDWMAAALEWSKTRGNRSGRTAWQFVTAWAGEAGKPVAF